MSADANDPVAQMLRQAIEHHQAGRMPQAEQLYRRILAQEPDHADALHMLGVLAAQVGRADVAVDLIRRAIALRPEAEVSPTDVARVARACATGKSLKPAGSSTPAVA